jgi:hypothetical protein
MASTGIKLRRTPPGMLSRSPPVFMRLTSGERQLLEQLSTQQGRSMASVARLIFLAGIHRYQTKASDASAERAPVQITGSTEVADDIPSV